MPASPLRNLTDRDKRALLYARDQYVAGHQFLEAADVAEVFACDIREGRSILRGLASLGAVDERTEGSVATFRHTTWLLLPQVTVLAHEMESPTDQVESLKQWANTHSVVSKVIVTVLLLAFVITLINGAWDFYERIVGRDRNEQQQSQ